jgi:hypothetical protein
LGLYTFIFAKPGSTTKYIPSIVRDASAIFVAITHFLEPAGAGSNISDCYSLGKAE